MSDLWPEIPYPAWQETCGALHLFTQIVGKYRLARAPWINHSWQATLYVDARGLTTSIIPDRCGGTEIRFDLVDHRVIGTASDGSRSDFRLGPMSVAAFRDRFVKLLHDIGATPDFDGRPNEIPDARPFAEDADERPYDADAVNRFFHALVCVDGVFKHFRTGFLGKCSPVHLFWGSFDLAVTRFSGRHAPLHPGGVPALPDQVTREAYSHEVSSAGFWPGGGGVDFPAFYSYAYPSPPDFASVRVDPPDAFFHQALGEFILPYDVVARSSDPQGTLLAFLESTYRGAADLGGWHRSVLECPIGRPRTPRPI